MSTSSVPAFVLFGPAHLAAIAATVVAAVGLCWLVRRAPRAGPSVRLGLASVLAMATLGYFAAVARTGRLSPWDFAPLHLCDFLIFVAAFALLTLEPLACEVLYFWACTGTLLAMITPDLTEGWPDWRFVTYFVLHSAVVVAAVVITFGFGRRPRRGAPWRVFALTNAYALAVGIVDAVSGMNFLYLREKPFAPTLLDWFGPWPVYLLAVEALALGLFFALDRATRARRLHARDSAG